MRSFGSDEINVCGGAFSLLRCTKGLDVTALLAGKLNAEVACEEQQMANKKAERYIVGQNSRKLIISQASIVTECTEAEILIEHNAELRTAVCS